MRIFRSVLSRCALALAACLSLVGYSGIALAADYAYASTLQAAKFAGHYGAESAKFKAEQAYAVSADAVELTTTGLLARESNGYRLAELVNVAVNGSEVAKGKVGVGPSAVA